MTDTAFDTLEATRRLEAAGIRAEQADAFVKVVNQSASQTVAVERFEAAAERFDAAVAGLHSRIDSVHAELSARIDSVHSELSSRIDSLHSELSSRIDSLHNKFDSGQAELLARIDSTGSKLQAENFRTQLIVVGIFLASNALIATIFGILLTNGAFGTVTFGAP